MSLKVFKLLHQGSAVEFITILFYVYACRILLNVGSNESLDSFSDISTKSRYLRRLLIEKQLGLIFCLKFKLVTIYLEHLK